MTSDAQREAIDWWRGRPPYPSLPSDEAFAEFVGWYWAADEQDEGVERIVCALEVNDDE